MDWIRGEAVGRGSFATVNFAVPKDGSARLFPSPAAVKSAEASTSCWLENEKSVLDRLGDCSRVIRCYGGDYSIENGGEEYYNIFLEYAAGGSLSDELRRSNGRIPEHKARRYARSIAEGLMQIHGNGFVHCDIKLQNVLLFGDGKVKIADFGLAKEAGKSPGKKFECRGTPLSMSPESVSNGECESPADVWALGCAVVEMVTGKPAWNVPQGSSIWSLLLRIGIRGEVPLIPDEISEEAKDFLSKCFVRDPRKRWTAEMLLNHPFLVSDDTVSLKEPSPSPRSHFDFPDWVSSVNGSVPSSPGDWDFGSSCSCSAADRLGKLATNRRLPANWSESGSDSWTSVRWN